MKKRFTTTELTEAYRHLPQPLLFIFAPIIGLSYIILLPFLGILLFIMAGIHGGKRVRV